MGKNYTLYIKPAKFDDEANKSGLVNTLLDGYYKDIDKGFGTFKEHGKPVEITREIALKPTAKPGMFDKQLAFCKHDAVVGSCKKGCK